MSGLLKFLRDYFFEGTVKLTYEDSLLRVMLEGSWNYAGRWADYSLAAVEDRSFMGEFYPQVVAANPEEENGNWIDEIDHHFAGQSWVEWKFKKDIGSIAVLEGLVVKESVIGVRPVEDPTEPFGGYEQGFLRAICEEEVRK